MNDDTSDFTFWIDPDCSGALITDDDGNIMICDECPVEKICQPCVIASFVTHGKDGRDTWNLTPYQGEGIGFPGAVWRIRDVGESHHHDPSASCTGTVYESGEIDETGTLVGLPKKFVSKYDYEGYMELQQGCRTENGDIIWTCP